MSLRRPSTSPQGTLECRIRDNVGDTPALTVLFGADSNGNAVDPAGSAADRTISLLLPFMDGPLPAPINPFPGHVVLRLGSGANTTELRAQQVRLNTADQENGSFTGMAHFLTSGGAGEWAEFEVRCPSADRR